MRELFRPRLDARPGVAAGVTSRTGRPSVRRPPRRAGPNAAVETTPSRLEHTTGGTVQIHGSVAADRCPSAGRGAAPERAWRAPPHGRRNVRERRRLLPSGRAARAAKVRGDAEPRRHLDPRALAGAARRARCRPPSCSGSPRSSTAPASPTSRSRAAASSTAPSGAGSRARGSGSARSRRARRRRSRSRVRGRFLVGSRPVGDDLVRRFMASAAESGIDVFRLHDPLNDVDNLRVAAEAIVAAGREFDAGLLYGSSRHEALVEAAKRLPEIGAARDPARRPGRRCCSRTARASSSPSCASSRACRSASTPGRRPQRRSRSRSRRARRRRPDRLRRLSGRARDAPRSRPSRSPRRSPGSATTRASTSTSLWRAADLVDEHIGDMPITPLAPARSRCARRAASFRSASSRRSTTQLRAQRPGRPARRGARRGRARARRRSARRRSPRRSARSSPRRRCQRARREPLRHDRRRAARPRRSAASAARPARSTRRSSAPSSCSAAASRRRSRSTSTRCASRPQGLAASEEELLLLALFGDEAEPLLHSIRQRARRRASRCPRPALGQRPRRADPRGRPDRPGDRRRRDHGRGGRHARQRPPHASTRRSPRRAAATAADELDAPALPPRATGSCASRARWSAPSTARPSPARRRSSRRATRSSPGQVLCILEAMKLMNEVKAEIEGDRPQDPRRRRRSRSSTASCCSSSSR